MAANLLNIPGVKPLEKDVVALSASLADLRQQVLFLQSSVSKPEATNLMARPNFDHVQSHTDLSSKRLAGISDFGTAPKDEFSPPALGLASSPSGSVTCGELASDVTKLKIACSTSQNADSTVGLGLPSVASELKTVYESSTLVPLSVSSYTVPTAVTGLDSVVSNFLPAYITPASAWLLPVEEKADINTCELSVANCKSVLKAVKPSSVIHNVYNMTLEAASVVRAWHCKITNVHKDVLVYVLKDHLRDFEVEAISVKKLRSKSMSSISMHFKDKVMCNNFWPSGIYVSG